VQSSTSGPRNIDALFFMLGYDSYRFNKKPVGTRYTELVFFNLVGSVSHVVYSGVFKPQNVNALFFMLERA
jgi:hypothetical protein